MKQLIGQLQNRPDDVIGGVMSLGAICNGPGYNPLTQDVTAGAGNVSERVYNNQQYHNFTTYKSRRKNES